MRTITILAIILISKVGYTQMYAYYNGYVDGYHKACGCNKKIETSHNLLYNNGTWNDGYNAGFVDGRVERSQNKNQQSKPSIYKPDYDLLQQSLSQKQSTLNHRRQLIQNEYYAIQDIFLVILERRSTKIMTQNEKEYFQKLKEITNKYVNYDLTNDSTFNQVMNWLRNEKDKVSGW